MAGRKPVLLCILDGWGHREESQDNAILNAKTPFWNQAWKTYPHALLEASEDYVGLPHGQMGNSEVGHMSLGSGRIILQDLPRIDKAVAENSIPTLPAFQNFIQDLKASGGACHLLGLFSPGGVHSHEDQILGLAKAVASEDIPVWIHAFLDGRDVPPQSARTSLEKLESFCQENPLVKIATLGGRYYGMDRDHRWERIEKAYDAMVSAKAPHAKSPQTALEDSYKNKVTDEFVIPVVIDDYKGMNAGDGILMGNFRTDRAREILEALLSPRFKGFQRTKFISFTSALGLVEYSENHNHWMKTLFAPDFPKETLGEVISHHGLTQLRIAETEKYAHVTFFFNGGREENFPGEDRILVPSPKVATYDLKPEMSAPEVTDQLVNAIQNQDYDLIVVNYANGDMVGHTGNEAAAIIAVETIDTCLSRIWKAIKDKGGALLITADHGNAEMMYDIAGKCPHTAHTLNPVPFLLLDESQKNVTLRDGKLSDVAPTILEMMGIPQPHAMTGHSLMIQERQVHASA
ncbi:2,3-bisphosphoglycerate-independent phosphoglycerate mutase [Candidatus Bealeia paramacronuclearis]|uniref:2,3-bisphosphoglycerate-independent phosphoglycerate mutase n=1 Tax=Candidatus Bealeia paramacronuclearis TaxID=1921001 RepID=A0ABZ2C172_9PROT|nr:2,3-bisphosphoglycerate-independent phosphoglycerate mutase [Candidatus Bealeia paramacronuclearis]